MTPTHTDFLEFCKLALGTSEPSGATVSALLEAYLRLGNPPPAGLPIRPETLNYTQPWQVYIIRNTVNGRVYVGRAAKGFLERYPDCAWWLTHNDVLAQDSLMYGTAAFRVTVYQCVDCDDMCAYERLLYDHSAERGRVYNKVRPSGITPISFLPLPETP